MTIVATLRIPVNTKWMTAASNRDYQVLNRKTTGSLTRPTDPCIPTHAVPYALRLGSVTM